MRRLAFTPALCFATLLFFLAPGQSFADESVSLDVQVVHASSGRDYVDPTLMTLKQKLTRLFNYSSFEIISKMKKEARKNEVGHFSIPGERNMEVVPVEIGAEKVRLNVKVLRGTSSVVNTALKMERGSIVMVGGPEFKGGVLIILISAD